MKEAEIIENWEFVEQKFVEYDDGVITMVDAVRSILDHLESQPNKGQDLVPRLSTGEPIGVTTTGELPHPTDEAQRFEDGQNVDEFLMWASRNGWQYTTGVFIHMHDEVPNKWVQELYKEFKVWQQSNNTEPNKEQG